jgi:long-chain acyl-CoA synthetase
MSAQGGPATFCAAFQETAARHAAKVAIRSPGGSVALTWGEYASRVQQIAAGLARLGIGRGDTVAIMMTNRPEFHLLDTAIIHLGAVPFSVYNTFAPGQIQHVLDDAGARVVVAEEQFAARLQAAADETAVRHIVYVDDAPGRSLALDQVAADGDHAPGFEASWRTVQPGDLLTLLYTSGTTGPPKGIEITHAQMFAWLNAIDAVTMAAGPDDRLVSYLPMAHATERFTTHYMPMISGAQVTDLADTAALPAALREVRPTIFGGPPRVWEKLKAAAEALIAWEPDEPRRQAIQHAMQIALRHAAAGPAPPEATPGREQALPGIRAALGLDHLRIAVSASAPIAPGILEYMLALGIPITEAWGLSEAGVVTINRPDAIRTGTVGTVLPGYQLTAARDGELLVRGPIMKGYHNDPVRTAETIDLAGWLHSGDIGTIDADGYVRITGRKKEMIINAAGKNMSPANIENAVLAASPLIGHVVVIGDRRPYIVGLIALDPDTAAAFAARGGATDTSPAALAANPAIRTAVDAAVHAANGTLSRVEQIKRYTIVPAFWEPGGDELTPTMKLKRQPIAAKHAEIIDYMYANTAETA